MKITPDAPKSESGHIQFIRMGKSIRHKWVKVCSMVRVKFHQLPVDMSCDMAYLHFSLSTAVLANIRGFEP